MTSEGLGPREAIREEAKKKVLPPRHLEKVVGIHKGPLQQLVQIVDARVQMIGHFLLDEGDSQDCMHPHRLKAARGGDGRSWRAVVEKEGGYAVGGSGGLGLTC